MSEEECIFCRIIAGEIPSRTVFESAEVMAFLDANPLARGHTLVVPTDHHRRVQELPTATARSLWAAVSELVGPIETAVEADASNVGLNNGPASGQEIPHVHVHIVPRFEGDGGQPIHAVGGTPPSLDDAQLDEVADAIRAAQ